MRTLKAYQVHDGDEGWSIQFATNSATARREGANDIGCEWSDIESCRRMPVLDEHAPGPVPASAMLAAGWHFECMHCGTDVYDDHDGHIAEGPNVYCSARCSQAEWVERRTRERAQVDLIELFESKFPGCTIDHVHVYMRLEKREGKNDGGKALVRFSFPGSQYGATFEYGDDYVSVAFADQDAWHAWRSSSVHRNQEGSESNG